MPTAYLDFPATDDANVMQDDQNGNDDVSPILRVRNASGHQQHAYLKFGPLTGFPENATFVTTGRIYLNVPATEYPSGIWVDNAPHIGRCSSNDWSEGSITWNNKPGTVVDNDFDFGGAMTMGPGQVATNQGVVNGNWTLDEVYSFVVKGGGASDAFDFASRDYGSNHELAPFLRVFYTTP